MNLYELLVGAGLSISVPDCIVNGVTESIDNVKNGSVFVAVRGEKYDGNEYAARALEKGAVCIVTEEEACTDLFVHTEDARLALDDKAPLEDYNNDAYMSITDFDNGKGIGFTHSDNDTGANTGSHYEILEDTARGGMYQKLTYGYQNDTNPKTGANITPKQQFIGKSGLPGTIPFVIEFDLTGDNGVEAFPFNRLDRTGSVTQMTMFAIRTTFTREF